MKLDKVSASNDISDACAIINRNFQKILDRIESRIGNLFAEGDIETDGNMTAAGSVSNGNRITIANNWFFFGYITSSAKALRVLVPLPGFGWTNVSVDGQPNRFIVFRGGTGTTTQVDDFEPENVQLRNGGSLLYFELALTSAYPGGNNVPMVGYLTGLEVSLE